MPAGAALPTTCGKVAWKLLPIPVLVGWVFFGAFVFQITEEPYAIQQIRLSGTTPRSDDWNTKWDFWESFAFTLSLDMSVGYPHREPQTNRGKTFAVIHFIIALPLVLRTLYLIGDGLSLFCLWVHRKMMQLIYERRKHFRRVNTESVEDLDHVALFLPIWLMVIITTLLLLLLAAFLLAYYSDWRPSLDRTYGDALYLYLISLETVGYLKPDKDSQARSDIVILTLVLLGLGLIFMVIRLIQRRIASIATQVTLLIDERYKRYLMLGEEGIMPTKPIDVKHSIAALVSNETIFNRFWYLFMSNERYDRIVKHWYIVANRRTSDTQTKELSFEPRMYGIGSSRNEFRKSRDDVNSLVAMLDFNLRPFGSEVRTHETIQES